MPDRKALDIAHRDLDVLIFVEDPGAANFIATLPRTMGEQGFRVKILAAGSARQYLRERNVLWEEMPADAASVIEAARPRLLVTGTSANPNTAAFALTTAARSAGVTSVGIVDARSNAGFRFRGRSNDPLAFAPDRIIMPDEHTRKAFAALGMANERMSICTHPQHEQVRSEAQRLAMVTRHELRQSLFPDAQGRKILLFIAEPKGGPDPDIDRRSAEYTLTGRGGSDDRTDIVLEEVLDAVREIEPRPFMVLRLHPRNKEEDFAPYLKEIAMVSKGGSPLEAAYAADLVVGMTSLLMEEAALLGTQVLSVLPRTREKTWLPAIEDGSIPCVTTREDLQRRLAELLSGRQPAMANRNMSAAAPTPRVQDILFEMLATGCVRTTAKER
ncbi:MAG: hypothetical protein AABZ15_14665 [Nitrospirota bacterium]